MVYIFYLKKKSKIQSKDLGQMLWERVLYSEKLRQLLFWSDIILTNASLALFIDQISQHSCHCLPAPYSLLQILL